MENTSHHLLRYAQELAREIDARAMVISVNALEDGAGLNGFLQLLEFPTILVARSSGLAIPSESESCTLVTVPDVHMTRASQVKAGLLVCLARGILAKNDRVVCLTGIDGSGILDNLLVLDLATEPELMSLIDAAALESDVAPEVFERVLLLATRLAVEGREGRPVGALFVVGDSDQVLAQSRSLVLNPFQGHPKAERNVLDPGLEETIKEFAALDGAFVVRGDGVVLTAGTQLVPAAPHPELPGGLGTRHAAASAITASTRGVAVCVSQSTGTVAVFKAGQLVTEIQRAAPVGRLVI